MAINVTPEAAVNVPTATLPKSIFSSHRPTSQRIMTERLLCKIKFYDISRASCLACTISTKEGYVKCQRENRPQRRQRDRERRKKLNLKNVHSNYMIRRRSTTQASERDKSSDTDGCLCAIYARHEIDCH